MVNFFVVLNFIVLIRLLLTIVNISSRYRTPLKEVLGGQYNYREGGSQVLRQGA